MAVTAIASATKYYIKESSRVEYFPIEAKKQLELAYLYLDNAETENQIRSALVHMENSALKIFDSGFDIIQIKIYKIFKIHIQTQILL